MLSAFKTALGRRIGGSVAITLLIGGGVGMFALLEGASARRQATAAAAMRTLGESVAASFSVFDPRHERHPIDDITAELAARGELERLDVFDHRGAIKWSLDPAQRGQPVAAGLLAAARSRTTTITEAGAIIALPKRSSCLPCHAKSPDPIGAVVIRSRPASFLGGDTRFAMIAWAGLGLFVLVMSLLVVAMVNIGVLRPLKKLVHAMDKAEEGDFFARAEVRSNDEIGLVASSFNKLLAKITDLRVETIDAAREIGEARAELGEAQAKSKISEQLEVTNSHLENRLEKLAFLYDLGRQLASRLDVDELVERIADLAHRGLRVPELAIVMLDPDEGPATVVAARGFEPGTVTEGRRVRADSLISGPSAEALEPVYVADVAEHGAPILDGRPSVGSLLAMPLLQDGRRLAWLYFGSPRAEAFGADERELFTAVGHQAALALSNALLFQATVELSRTDGLTGIANRRALEQRLDLEWSRAQRYEDPLSVIMIDIDYFKVYNDQHGHQKGDEALRRVARILSRNVRKVDVVGRYGGEEFLVALPSIGRSEAETVANKLRRSVEQADFDGGYMQPLGRVTISCGVATAPDDARKLESLIEKADAALFRAKAGGRNSVVVS